jgi:hypothetical protein
MVGRVEAAGVFRTLSVWPVPEILAAVHVAAFLALEFIDLPLPKLAKIYCPEGEALRPLHLHLNHLAPLYPKVKVRGVGDGAQWVRPKPHA